MMRVGLVLSALAAVAWIGLTAVTVLGARAGHDAASPRDALPLVFFLLPLLFVIVIALIWAVIGLVIEIQLFRAGRGRWANERFARRP